MKLSNDSGKIIRYIHEKIHVRILPKDFRDLPVHEVGPLQIVLHREGVVGGQRRDNCHHSNNERPDREIGSHMDSCPQPPQG